MINPETKNNLYEIIAKSISNDIYVAYDEDVKSYMKTSPLLIKFIQRYRDITSLSELDPHDPVLVIIRTL